MANPVGDDDELVMIVEDDEDFEPDPMVRPGSSNNGVASASGPWRLLLVDDEPAVHEVTRLALRGLEVRGRRCELVSAMSGEDGRRLLSAPHNHGSFAVAIVDVVMETETAGTDLVRWMRQ